MNPADPMATCDRRIGFVVPEFLAVQEGERSGTVVGGLPDPGAVLGHVAALAITAASADGQITATAVASTEERLRATEDELGIAAGRAVFDLADDRFLFAGAAIGFVSDAGHNGRGGAVVATIGCACHAADRQCQYRGREGPHHLSVTHCVILSR